MARRKKEEKKHILPFVKRESVLPAQTAALVAANRRYTLSRTTSIQRAKLIAHPSNAMEYISALRERQTRVHRHTYTGRQQRQQQR